MAVRILWARRQQAEPQGMRSKTVRVAVGWTFASQSCVKQDTIKWQMSNGIVHEGSALSKGFVAPKAVDGIF